jgi:hypothetical protein
MASAPDEGHLPVLEHIVPEPHIDPMQSASNERWL